MKKCGGREHDTRWVSPEGARGGLEAIDPNWSMLTPLPKVKNSFLVAILAVLVPC